MIIRNKSTVTSSYRHNIYITEILFNGDSNGGYYL